MTRTVPGASETPEGKAVPAASSRRQAKLSARPYLLLQGEVLRTAACFRENSFDLVYVDPPFFTGRSRRSATGMGFRDQWGGNLDGYLSWVMPRIARLRQLLRPTGSLWIHLDWHAVHEVKVEMDKLFGRECFINEIIWSYRTGGVGGKRLARKHDTILFYARGPQYKFHRIRERSNLSHKYGFSNAGVLVDQGGPYRMTLMRDVWELPALRGNSPERLPFPTQKPLALMRRIIELVTDPGDLVGDFLCGSGTSLQAALELGRLAVGADISPEAVALTGRRLSGKPQRLESEGDLSQQGIPTPRDLTNKPAQRIRAAQPAPPAHVCRQWEH